MDVLIDQMGILIDFISSILGFVRSYILTLAMTLVPCNLVVEVSIFQDEDTAI